MRVYFLGYPMQCSWCMRVCMAGGAAMYISIDIVFAFIMILHVYYIHRLWNGRAGRAV